MMSNEEDPCAVLAELRKAKRNLLIKGSTTKTRFRSASGSERETSRSKINEASLDEEIRKYEELCSLSLGKTGRRFAARAG